MLLASIPEQFRISTLQPVGVYYQAG